MIIWRVAFMFVGGIAAIISSLSFRKEIDEIGYS